MSIAAIFVNDLDLETEFDFHGSSIVGWPGNLSKAPRTVPLLTGPEMDGAIIDPLLIRRGAAQSSLGGIILAASPTAAAAQLSALSELLYVGAEVAVRTIYAPDRQCLAVCTGFSGQPRNSTDINGEVTIALSFVVKDGVAEALAPSGYALSSTAVACPIGDAESYPVITVHGGGSTLVNPVITLRDKGGVIVQEMAFTVTLGATAALLIDSARARASLVTAGVVTDALEAGYWDPTAGDFPVLRPADAYVTGEAFPTVELSADSGTPVGLISYRRRYL